MGWARTEGYQYHTGDTSQTDMQTIANLLEQTTANQKQLLSPRRATGAEADQGKQIIPAPKGREEPGKKDQKRPPWAGANRDRE